MRALILSRCVTHKVGNNRDGQQKWGWPAELATKGVANRVANNADACADFHQVQKPLAAGCLLLTVGPVLVRPGGP